MSLFAAIRNHRAVLVFFKKCAIERDEWESFIRYSVPVVYDEKQKVNVVSPFMRDGLQAAYVPGSSLKGVDPHDFIWRKTRPGNE